MTILGSSEVGLLALEALVVAVDGKCVLLWFLVVRVLGVGDARILILVLVLEPLKGLVPDIICQHLELIDDDLDCTSFLEVHPHLAERAEAEVEVHPRPQPLGIKSLEHTVVVEYLSITLELYT